MSFAVAADSYDRFMGRYSVPLAPQLAELAGIEAGQRAIDVGCGPGALTTELVHRFDPGTLHRDRLTRPDTHRGRIGERVETGPQTREEAA